MLDRIDIGEFEYLVPSEVQGCLNLSSNSLSLPCTSVDINNLLDIELHKLAEILVDHALSKKKLQL